MRNSDNNSDFVNGCLLILGAMIWPAIARQFVPDSSVGVAMILVPSGLLVLSGAFFIFRFSIKNLR
jgi:hypothetical protein